MRYPLIILAFSLATACSIPDPSTVPLICDTENPCPDGRICEESGKCSAPPDLSMAAPGDMSMPPDEGTPDMSEGNGCKTGGTRLAAGEWKCPGTFGGAVKASSLCATGFSLCSKLSATALAACNGGPNFFASSFIGSRKDTDPVGTAKCDQTEIVKVIFGCGSGGTTASMVCSTLTKIIDCSAAVALWTCGNTLDMTTSKSSANGVLCCAD